MGFERIRTEEIWQGHIGGVRVDTFRYDDGREATREIVSHPGAVTVLPFDPPQGAGGGHVWLVRQPREPVGEQALLELPAGKIDVPGEDFLETAKRELAEEIGMGARDWRHLVSFYNSPGLLSEENHLFLAQDLYEQTASSEEEERIEIVRLPIGELDATIAGLKDAKTLIGLLWLRSFLL
ncbi:MAG TPA: NUDIX hydrolase [Thermoleophilaceae bacterium]|nr:NUDIX hydrolase [Thermoleophilaceae bacterium]